MNMPKLRFKADNNSDFPEWKSMSLDIACEINPETESLADQFYYIDLRSIDNGQWIEPKLLQKSSAPSRARRVATEDDVFFQSVRPYNKGHYHFTQYRDNQVVASTGFIQARMRNGSNSFLYHLFFSDDFNKKVTFLCSGSSYPAINSTEFGKIVVSLPSAQEQCKIAECLDSVDKVIEKQQAEIKAWEQYKKGVAQKLFDQEVRFKADDGSAFPVWDSMNFGNVFDEISNNTLARAKLSDESGQAKNIHYGDIHTKFGEILDLKKEILPYIIPEVDCSRMMPLQDGDIVLADTAEDNTVGKAVEVHNVGSNVLYAGLHTIARRPKFKFAPKYLGYYINSNAYHDQLIPYMQGTKQPAISKAHILLTHIAIPSLQEQRKIAECLDAIDDVIALAKAELEKWHELKKGLLQQLFV